MVMQEMPQAARHVRARSAAQYDKKGEKVDAGVPGVPAAAARRARRPTASAWRTGWSIPTHPLTARVIGQPLLADVLRHRPGQDGRGLRLAGRAAEPSRAARLAGRRVPSPREHGWDVKALLRLIVTSATYRQSSAVTPELLAQATRRTGCWPAARGSGCRPSSSATRRWPSAGCSNGEIGGAERLALSARRAVGGADVARRRQELDGPDLRAEPRRGPVPPDDVHVLEADLAAADAGDVRRPRPRDLHRPPRRAPTRRCRRWCC